KPYESILDFTAKMKLDGASRSVHKGVIVKLIASGVMDSLFPKECVSVQDKIACYLEKKAVVEQSVKIDEIPLEYQSTDEIDVFKNVKQVIPVFSMDLRYPILTRMGYSKQVRPNKTLYSYQANGKQYIDGYSIDRIQKMMIEDPEIQRTYDKKIFTYSYVI